VLELDLGARRLALGHKQLEENPWDTFATVFTPGSVHRATITEKSERGAVLELPYGIEGFAYPKGLVKEDNSNAENGEALDFRVTEFSKDDRRIVLSHTAVYNTAAAAEEDGRNAKFKKKTNVKGDAQGEGKMSDLKKTTEDKSTLGDLDALSALRDQMMGNERKAGEQKLKAQAQAKTEAPAEATAEAAPAEGGLLASVSNAASAAIDKVKEVAADAVDAVTHSEAFEKASEVAGDLVDKAKNLVAGDDAADKDEETKA
jgi:small subunit ribosomal protein S1